MNECLTKIAKALSKVASNKKISGKLFDEIRCNNVMYPDKILLDYYNLLKDYYSGIDKKEIINRIVLLQSAQEENESEYIAKSINLSDKEKGVNAAKIFISYMLINLIKRVLIEGGEVEWRDAKHIAALALKTGDENIKIIATKSLDIFTK